MSFEVEKIRPYSSQEEKKSQIESMFDNIAHKYDFLNHLLSFGIDILWRKKAIKELSSIRPKRIMDMASGTGDFAFEALSLMPEKIIGVDLSINMLEKGIEKANKRNVSHIVSFEKGDSEALQYEDNSFDAITVGFGVRNFENLEKGLKELYRVLRKGGKIVILEPSFPHNPFVRFLFNIHFRFVTPFFGKLFSNDARAYSYLPDSVEVFPQGDSFLKILSDCGYTDTKYKPLSLGICAMYIAEK